MKNFEQAAIEALRTVLAAVEDIRIEHIDREVSAHGREIDIRADVTAFGRSHRFICEVKDRGQPRHVRDAVVQLRDRLARLPADRNVTPVIITTYLSAEARALCRDAGVSFIDLEGNARVVFDGVFIDRSVATKPAAQRRSLKSIFKPKSAQVLRTMLGDPAREWRVVDLAKAAHVSLGQVSNVRRSLLDREWAKVSGDGLYLSAPDKVLDAWRDSGDVPTGERHLFYTSLHGKDFDAMTRHAFRSTVSPNGHGAHAILASFSAARWLSPYARTNMQHFYSDRPGLDLLKTSLRLSGASKGENVAVTVTDDHGVFLDAVEPVCGVFCTSPVQTYLDLAAAGERGREAAAHLRSAKLGWQL